MNNTGGVVLIMGGVLGLYLLWAANSPFNRGAPGTTPPSGGTPPPPGTPPDGQVDIPTPHGIVPVNPNLPWYEQPQIPDGNPEGNPDPYSLNPFDPCNPIYIRVWGAAECHGVHVNPPGFNPARDVLGTTYGGYIPFGYQDTSYGTVGGGHPIGTPYGTGVN